jgi:hypothetical protein
MLYHIWMFLGQHVPSSLGCQVFSIGVHWPHVIAMATPNDTFTVIMMNQISHLTHPDDIRKTVIAKEVLLQQAARIEKEPAKLVIRRYSLRSLWLNCDNGRPKPRFIDTETKESDKAREI